ncbi:MAG: ABC transporter ATP-binding protein [Prochlorotrichaceae cyanobacterium]|jgi:ABC-2 type transport system ATP-binding protein
MIKNAYATAIATTGLTKRYDRALALREVDLEIQRGALYGLIGPNGAGKTTLIQLLAVAQEPTLGEISFFGEVLRTDRPQPHLKRQIGYLPDDFPVYEDLSVWNYLDYFARLYQLQGKARQRRLQEVLELVNLTHKRHSLTSQLSRGMKQRLGLARTIIHDPAILLLDEPVSGLDPIARQEFREVMAILHSLGTTILISSHLLSDLAELCTHVGIMEMGCLVESTTLNALYDRFSRQSVQLKLLGSALDLPDLRQHLEKQPQVKDLQWLSPPEEAVTIVQFQYQGDSSDLAALLRSLVEANFPVVEFRPIQENLEDIFLKIGHTQAI